MSSPDASSSANGRRSQKPRTRRPRTRKARNAVASPVAELERTVRELRLQLGERLLADEKRQFTMRQMVMAQEEELRVISSELHDGVSQHLAALALGLKTLRDGRVPQPQALLQSLQAVTDALGKKVHDVALRLRPPSLDDLGLPQTLTNYLGQWSTHSGIATELHSSGWLPARGSSHIETVLYRIIGDALNHLVRPARASRVSIVLQHRDGQAVAIIEDDGAKTETTAYATGPASLLSPWNSLRERAALVNGELTVENNARRGTTIFVRVPLPTNGKEDL